MSLIISRTVRCCRSARAVLAMVTVARAVIATIKARMMNLLLQGDLSFSGEAESSVLLQRWRRDGVRDIVPFLRAESVREVKNRPTQTDQFTSILIVDGLLTLLDSAGTFAPV